MEGRGRGLTGKETVFPISAALVWLTESSGPSSVCFQGRDCEDTSQGRFVSRRNALRIRGRREREIIRQD
jgi:hypothetical protein